MKLRKEEAPEAVSTNAAVNILRSGTQNARYALAYVDSVEVIERHRFIDVAHEAAQWAERLRRVGLEPGGRVIVLAGRDRHWRSALFGVLEAGGVAVPCSESMPLAELRFLALEGRAVAVVSASPRPELVEPLEIPVLCPDDLDAGQRRYGSATGWHDATPDDFGLILYGRDGAGLRGEAHTHGSLLDRASASARVLGVRRGDTFWSTAPDGSAESVWLTLAAWHVGAEVVVVEAELAPNSKLELLHRLHGGAVWFSDDEYATLAAAHVPSWVDLTHVRHAFTSGQPSEGAVAFQEAFGVQAVPAKVALETAEVVAAPAPVADVVPLQVAPPLRQVDPPTGESERDLLREHAALEAAEERRRRGEEEKAARRREEQQAKERQKEEARQHELAETAARAERQRRAEEDKRREEERVRAEKESRRREAQQAKERQKEEERRRKEEAKQRELAEKAARAEEQRHAEETRRREEERLRAEKEALRREEQQARERAKQRTLAEKAARAEEERRAEEDKRREKERARAEKAARLTEAQQAKERQKQEEQRRKEEAKQRDLADKAARAEQQRRAEEAKRRAEEEQRRRREEAESRQRAEREAEQALRRAEDAERARRNAAVAEERPPAQDATRHARRPRPEPESDRADRLPPDVLSRLGQYGITTAIRNGDDGADEPERARTPDERRETR